MPPLAGAVLQAMRPNLPGWLEDESSAQQLMPSPALAVQPLDYSALRPQPEEPPEQAEVSVPIQCLPLWLHWRGGWVQARAAAHIGLPLCSRGHHPPQGWRLCSSEMLRATCLLSFFAPPSSCRLW